MQHSDQWPKLPFFLLGRCELLQPRAQLMGVFKTNDIPLLNLPTCPHANKHHNICPLLTHPLSTGLGLGAVVNSNSSHTPESPYDSHTSLLHPMFLVNQHCLTEVISQDSPQEFIVLILSNSYTWPCWRVLNFKKNLLHNSLKLK